MSFWSRFFRKQQDRDLEDEIRAHLAMAAHDHQERGASAQDAEHAALREFGNRALVKEVTRGTWTWTALETLAQDIRYGLRTLRRAPAFTAAAVLTLALGIGANTAIFSLINALMLRPLPVHKPSELVELLHRYPGEPRTNGFSWSSYEHFRNHNHVFSGLIGFAPARFSAQATGPAPETVESAYVTGDFFPVLGIRPTVGRLIGPEHDQPGAASSAVAVISWPYWQSRFNQDPSVVGRQITVNKVALTVIGVAPQGFTGLEPWMPRAIWVPAATEQAMKAAAGTPSGNQGRMSLGLVARLKPDVSIRQATAEMAVLFQFSLNEYARNSKDPVLQQMKFELASAGAGVSLLRDRFTSPLLLLMAVVAVLLLLACTNIASMLLARGAGRQREMALRVSLGAGRFRLVRQVLTESLLLSSMGSVLGVGLAYVGAGSLLRLISSGRTAPGLPQQIDLSLGPDLYVLLFTTVVALLTGLLFGLAPAWNAFSTAPASSLRDAGRAAETRTRRLFGKALVAAQVALSLMLLSAAGLFASHLAALQNVDLGFRRDHVLLVTLDPSKTGLGPGPLSQSYSELLTRFQAIPGVQSATFSAGTPLSGAGASRFVIVEGHAERPQDRRYVSLNWVASRFFETFGTPLLSGRDFSPEDRNRPPVVIVNQSLAQHYFPGVNPIGRHLTILNNGASTEGRSYEIVGIAGDANYYEILERKRRTVYLNEFQQPQLPLHFSLRTSIDPEAVAGDVRRTVDAVLSGSPITKVMTLDQQVNASIVTERVIAMLSGVFGGLGAMLAAIGLYGLLAYTVARRVNEIGVRIALGATGRDVMSMILGDAFRTVFIGLVLGLPAALWTRTLAAKLLPELPKDNLAPVVTGVLLMTAVALIASWLPARYASRVDPMEALRHE